MLLGETQTLIGEQSSPERKQETTSRLDRFVSSVEPLSSSSMVGYDAIIERVDLVGAAYGARNRRPAVGQFLIENSQVQTGMPISRLKGLQGEWSSNGDDLMVTNCSLSLFKGTEIDLAGSGSQDSGTTRKSMACASSCSAKLSRVSFR
jgi:hypothetical protein